MVTRRDLIRLSGLAVPLVGAVSAARAAPPPNWERAAQDAGARSGYVPTRTLNGWTLPHRMVDGVKEFHLVAEEFEHEFAPGSRAKVWGYNGSTPGPTLEAVEGDRVRILVT